MKTATIFGTRALIFLAPMLMTSAFAADLPSRTAPPVYVPPPLPVFSWTGFYAGVQGGYAFGKDNTTAAISSRTRRVPVGGEGGEGGVGIEQAAAVRPVGTRGGGTTLANLSSSPNGVVGGGHVGYNFSTQGLFGNLLGPAGIFGIEGDAEGLDYNKTTSFGTGFGVASSRISSDLQGSIRGRIGVAFDRFLVYGTGGAAFADFKTGFSLAGSAFDTYNRTRVGYTVGGGVEYAFTPNWSLRAEYRYSDYGSFPGEADTTVRRISDVTLRHRETIQRVEGGISYLFTTPVAPVVARY